MDPWYYGGVSQLIISENQYLVLFVQWCFEGVSQPIAPLYFGGVSQLIISETQYFIIFAPWCSGRVSQLSISANHCFFLFLQTVVFRRREPG